MEAIILIFLVLGIIGLIAHVADWFQQQKDINIWPGSAVCVVGILALAFSTGFQEDDPWKWLCLVLGTIFILGTAVYNIKRYGAKAGTLASLAEVVFGAAVAFFILLVLVSSNNNKKKKKK